MADEEIRESICGLWCDGANVHLCLRDESGARRNACVKFDPFMWSASGAECAYASAELLSRPAGGVPPTPLDSLLFFESVADMNKYFKSRDKSLPSDRISCVENQFLTARGCACLLECAFQTCAACSLTSKLSARAAAFRRRPARATG